MDSIVPGGDGFGKRTPAVLRYGMSITATQIELLLEELGPLLRDAILRRVWCRNRLSLVLELRVIGENRFLLLSVEEGGVRLHLVRGKPEQPARPPDFILLLRKHLPGRRVLSIDQVDRDRVVRLRLQEKSGGVAELVAELTGRHANLFLVDGETILGSLQPNRSFRRRLVPGERYQYPFPPASGGSRQGREDPLDLAGLPADGSRSRRLGEHMEARLERSAAARLARELLRRLRREEKRLRRSLESVAADLERAGDASKYRRWGELLRGAHGKVPRGATAVEVPDYYTEGMPPVSIPLDGKLDLGGNIARYFKLYRKYGDAAAGIRERKARLEERSQRVLEALQGAAALAAAATAGEVGATPAAGVEPLDPAAGVERLEERLEELEAAGVLKRSTPREAPPRRRTAEKAVPYRRFQSRTGKIILVGKGGRQNDSLTLRIARGGDLWLHAHDWAGAHVVVRLDRGEEVDHETLLDAATLAAHYSKAKEATRVEVIYTRAKHVSKPKGFPPGQVSVASPRTILVRPEEQRLRRLLDS